MMVQAPAVLLRCVVLAAVSEISFAAFHSQRSPAGTLSAEVSSSASSLLRRESLGPENKDDPTRHDVTTLNGAAGWIGDKTTVNGPAGPCTADICGDKGVVRLAGNSPTECRILDDCQKEECCLGFCGGYDCAQHVDSISKADGKMPPACAEYECTPEQCCTGTCNSDHCPEKSVPLGNDTRPERCDQQPCKPEECCRGTCEAVICPAGSQMSDTLKEKVCMSFPCDHTECCEPICQQSLCDAPHAADGAVPAVPKMLREFTGDETAHNVCAGMPCKREECCTGTCHESICGWNQPALPPDRQPDQCVGLECTKNECCEGRCTENFCAHFHINLQDGVSPDTVCAQDPCEPHECCAGECVDTQCPSDFGLLAKATFPEECQTINCTTTECCDSVCHESVCPHNRGLELKEAIHLPDRCAAATCDRTECCKELGR